MFAGIKSCKLEEFHKHYTSACVCEIMLLACLCYGILLQAYASLLSSESVPGLMIEALCEVSKKVASLRTT